MWTIKPGTWVVLILVALAMWAGILKLVGVW